MPPEEVREMWQSQPVPAQCPSADELRKFAAQVGRRLFWSNAVEYVAGAIAIAAFSFYIWHFKEAGVKVGSVFMILTTLYVLIQRRRWLKSDVMRVDIARTGCLVAYLRELERIRHYMAHLWRYYWGPFMVAFLVFFVAISTESWARNMAPWSWLLHGSFMLLIYAITLRASRVNTKRVKVLDDGIVQVKALLAGD